jgi:hypothetical protein
MRSHNVMGLLVGLFCIPAAALAVDRPESFDFEFGAAGGEISDFHVGWYDAFPGAEDENLEIVYLELEIAGLSHTSPADLNIFLLDPFGGGVEIMDDRGDMHAINDFTLTFSDFLDKAVPLPADPGALVDGGYYEPETPGSFTTYTNTGDDRWRLVVIDDSEGDSGSFESFTLRGVVVPEPATMSLLLLGSVALLRRRVVA